MASVELKLENLSEQRNKVINRAAACFFVVDWIVDCEQIRNRKRVVRRWTMEIFLLRKIEIFLKWFWMEFGYDSQWTYMIRVSADFIQ